MSASATQRMIVNGRDTRSLLWRSGAGNSQQARRSRAQVERSAFDKDVIIAGPIGHETRRIEPVARGLRRSLRLLITRRAESQQRYIAGVGDGHAALAVGEAKAHANRLTGMRCLRQLGKC